MSERSSHWQLQTIVGQLRSARDQWRTRNGRLSGEHGGRELPSREAVAQILEALCGALFPIGLGPGGFSRSATQPRPSLGASAAVWRKWLD